MFSSHILSRLLRFGLLGVFIVGLFVSIGEVSVNQNEGISLSHGGIHTVVAGDFDINTPASGYNPASGYQNTLPSQGGASSQVGPIATAGEKTAEPESKALETLIDIANLFIGVLTFLITPLIMLAGWLLSPDWTFGEIFGLRPILHQIWIFISNIVYVVFGFFLVFIAFANIFGGEHAKTYEMKSMLPKLVTGILIVPFTWFIVSAVLSISNILTASVIQLPIDTIQKAGSAGTFLDDKIIPKEITYDKDKKNTEGSTVDGNGNADTNGTNKANGNFYATDCTKAPDECLSIQEFLSNGKGGAYNLLSVYAYGIFKIQDYKMITTEEKLGTIGKIASKLSFGFLFFVVFGVLIIAIVYALFSRALILWLYAMFSPIFALNYVMDFKNESVKGSVGRMSIEKFLSLALVPVYVSAALAFGLMFLGLVMNAKGTITSTAGEGSLIGESGVEVNTTKDGVSTFKFGEVTLTTKGVLTGEQKKGLNGALDLGKGIIGTIIMNVLALVILWMAVMAALGADDITKAAVAPIKSFGDEVGKLALKSPQYIPIPLPGGHKVSMAGMQSVPNTISSALSQKASKEGGELGGTFAKALGIEVSELTTALRDATAKLKKNPNDLNAQKDVWKDIYGKIGDTKALNANKSEIVPKFEEMLAATHIQNAADRKNLEDALKSDPSKFITEFEKYLDTKNAGKGGGILPGGTPLNAENVLKNAKTNSAPIVTVSTLNITDPKDKNSGTVNVNVGEISISGLKIKNGKIEGEGKLQEDLKFKGIPSDQIKGIVEEIKSQIGGVATPSTERND